MKAVVAQKRTRSQENRRLASGTLEVLQCQECAIGGFPRIFEQDVSGVDQGSLEGGSSDKRMCAKNLDHVPF